MKLLLDTHTFLWFITGDAQLSTAARLLIEDPNNDKLLSVVVPWEIAIKWSIGRLTLTGPFSVVIPQGISSTGFPLLGITLDHLVAVASLPLHHRDPFDRLLIAQAIVEQLPIVSGDAAFAAYPITRLW